jgi:Type III secretion protein YscO
MSDRNLHKLMELRKIRMRIAEESSARQQLIYDTAAAAVDQAATRIIQNDEKRLGRETTMYEQLSNRTLGRKELDDYLDALSTLDYQASNLRQQEEQARDQLEKEAQRSREARAAHLVKHQQYDKLRILLEKQSARKDQYISLLAELDDEDQRPPSPAFHKGS